MKVRNEAWAPAAAMIALLLVTTGAGAQQPEHGHGGHARAPEHYDNQFNHNHYYYQRGVVVPAVPGRPYVVGCEAYRR